MEGRIDMKGQFQIAEFKGVMMAGATATMIRGSGQKNVKMLDATIQMNMLDATIRKCDTVTDETCARRLSLLP